MVATRVGGIPEVVLDGITGFLVEAGDVVAMANRVEALLESEELRIRMGAAAREHVREAFATKPVKEFEQLLRSYVVRLFEGAGSVVDRRPKAHLCNAYEKAEFRSRASTAFLRSLFGHVVFPCAFVVALQLLRPVCEEFINGLVCSRPTFVVIFVEHDNSAWLNLIV